MKVETAEFTAASVWNCHSRSPLAASSAVTRPSLRPRNTSPPAVTSEPLRQPSLKRFCHTMRLVARSSAEKMPLVGMPAPA